jgi:hypothetical protein
MQSTNYVQAIFVLLVKIKASVCVPSVYIPQWSDEKIQLLSSSLVLLLLYIISSFVCLDRGTWSEASRIEIL